MDRNYRTGEKLSEFAINRWKSSNICELNKSSYCAKAKNCGSLDVIYVGGKYPH